MFDIGWTEMLVIAVVLIVIVGPKDLPRMLRTFGKTTAKLRSMAGDFQKQFNDALKEADLDEFKSSVDSLRSLNPANEIKKQLNPFEKAAADVRSGLDAAMKPSSPKPAEPTAHVAEPLKNGAAVVPGSDEPAVEGPTKMPPAPVFPATSEKTTAAPATKPRKTSTSAKTSVSAKSGASARSGKAAQKAPAKASAAKSKAAPRKTASNRKTSGTAK